MRPNLAWAIAAGIVAFMSGAFLTRIEANSTPRPIGFYVVVVSTVTLGALVYESVRRVAIRVHRSTEIAKYFGLGASVASIGVLGLVFKIVTNSY